MAQGRTTVVALFLVALAMAAACGTDATVSASPAGAEASISKEEREAAKILAAGLAKEAVRQAGTKSIQDGIGDAKVYEQCHKECSKIEKDMAECTKMCKDVSVLAILGGDGAPAKDKSLASALIKRQAALNAADKSTKPDAASPPKDDEKEREKTLAAALMIAAARRAEANRAEKEAAAEAPKETAHADKSIKKATWADVCDVYEECYKECAKVQKDLAACTKMCKQLCVIAGMGAAGTDPAVAASPAGAPIAKNAAAMSLSAALIKQAIHEAAVKKDAQADTSNKEAAASKPAAAEKPIKKDVAPTAGTA